MKVTAEQAAQAFHEAYERLAPLYGYKTRDASAVPWSDVPVQNKALMTATAKDALFPLLDQAKAEGVTQEHDRMIYAVNEIEPMDKSGGLVKVEVLIAIGEAEQPPDLDATGERDRIRAILAEYERIALDAHESSEGDERIEWGGAVSAFAKMREAIDK